MTYGNLEQLYQKGDSFLDGDNQPNLSLFLGGPIVCKAVAEMRSKTKGVDLGTLDQWLCH